MVVKRVPFDSTAKAIARYRTLADQAKFNASKAADDAGREWFLALARTMTALADSLQEQTSNSR